MGELNVKGKKGRKGKNKGNRKNEAGLPLLNSSLISEEDLEEYLEEIGGYSKEIDCDEAYTEAAKEFSVKDTPPGPGGEKKGPRTLKTEQSSSKRTGTETLARAVQDAVPVKNIGGKLWIRMNPPCYRPMEVADVATILRAVGMLPKEDARLMLTCKDIYGCLASFPEIYLDELPIQKGRILFENIWYDVNLRQAVKPSEEDVLIHRVNAELHPDRIPTPVWDQFLETVSGGDKSIQALIRAMVGYLMLPEQEAKCFFVLGTAPDSGKSVLGEFLQRLFGAANTSAVSLHSLKSEFALAPILGKKLNLSMDLPADSLSQAAVGNIKTVTGNDLVSINVKYEPHRQQRLTSKFVFGTNAPLILNRPDPAFWNRVVYVPFMYSVPKEEQNKNLLADLWAERDGIVQQCVLAARSLIQHNYRFPPCKRAENMVRKWAQSDEHHVVDFVRDCCVTGDLTWYSGSSGLHIAYCHYGAQKGFSPTSLTSFSRILNEHAGSLGIRKRHRNDGWGFDGIMLHPNLDFPPEVWIKTVMPDL